MLSRRFACAFAAALTIAILATHTAAAQGACANPQSPRFIDPAATPSPFHHRSNTSIVKQWNHDSIVYKPRDGGAEQTLYLCGEHYHFPTENLQGCRPNPAGSALPGAAPPDLAASDPRPGDRVEIHTVYAAKRRPGNCDFRHLDCCEAPPFLVIAMEMVVTDSHGGHLPDFSKIAATVDRRAEWSGSTTGPDKRPGECKPAAQWSFVLECDMTISQEDLDQFFGHPQKPRTIQPDSRLSQDLTLVTLRHP